MLSDSVIGQLGGTSIILTNDSDPLPTEETPTLHELYCDETIPEKSPEPVPMPGPVRIVQWSNTQNRWLEGTAGKWRVAFSYFLSWYKNNIDLIQQVESHPKTDYVTFHELYLPIKQHYTDSILTQNKIKDKIKNQDFNHDIILDLELSHAIEVAISDGHWGIWPCVDRLANYCNIILTSTETHKTP